MKTKRNQYSPPKLKVFGPVGSLTQAGSGLAVEGSGMGGGMGMGMGMGGGNPNRRP